MKMKKTIETIIRCEDKQSQNIINKREIQNIYISKKEKVREKVIKEIR